MLYFLGWSAAGGVLGFLCVLMVKPEERGIDTHIMGAVVGVMCAAIFQSSYVTSNRVTSISESVQSLEADMSRVESEVGCGMSAVRTENEIYNVVAHNIRDDIETKCQQIYEGRIDLGPQEVKSVWTTLVRNSKEHIEATNTIIPDDWPKQSCNEQRKANVKIERIMIKERGRHGFNNKLDSLAARQKVECGVDKTYEYYRTDLLEGFADQVQLLSNIDLVVVDERIVLVTNNDRQSNEIINGYISTQSNHIDAATYIIDTITNQSEPQ